MDVSVIKTLKNLFQHEDINFLLTNRIPRRTLTQFIGWFSQMQTPWIVSLSIGIWRAFGDLDLADARKTSFSSVHDCFTRELKAGARSINSNPEVLCSPCDAIIGAHGRIQGGQVYQAKGFPYSIGDLIPDRSLASSYEGGSYVTLRLTAGMYHRFHAPYDCRVRKVTYISGDTWNVNPIALKRIEKLFCKNERAVLECEFQSERGASAVLTVVPVAAILVASIRLHFLDALLYMGYKGPTEIPCNARFEKGDEMGWFQHGSTIILFTPGNFEIEAGKNIGDRVQMGEALMRHL